MAQCLDCGETAPAERHRLLERLSIMNSIENLRTFPCISALEASGRIALHGAWFDIALGELHVLDQSTGTWERLESRDAA